MKATRGLTIHDLSATEHATIRAFLQVAADDGLLAGTVTDFGCGKQPYRSIVERGGGVYVPYDRKRFGGNVSGQDIGADPLARSCDAALSTQVLQYAPDPAVYLATVAATLRPGGHLVMTGPTHWPELRDDLWRFTLLGVRRLLVAAGFTVIRLESRAAVELEGCVLSIGWGAVART